MRGAVYGYNLNPMFQNQLAAPDLEQCVKTTRPATSHVGKNCTAETTIFAEEYALTLCRRKSVPNDVEHG